MVEPNLLKIVQNADALLESGRIHEAKQLYTKAAKLDPLNADSHFMLGVIAYDENDLVLAENEFKQCLSVDDTYADAHSHYANILLKKNNINEALVHAKKAVEYDAEYVEAWVLLSVVQANTNDLSAAEFSCRKAMMLWPEKPDLYSTLGALLSRQNKYSEAIPVYEKLVDLQQDNIEAKNDLARTYIQCGYEDKALSLAKSTIDSNKGNADTWFLQGVAAISNHDYMLSRDSFLKAISLNPEYISAYINLGKLYLKENEPENAYEIFLRVQGKSIECRAGVAECLNRIGRVEEALTVAESCFKASPDDSYIKYIYACSLFESGQATKAERYLREIQVNNRSEAACYVKLSQICLRDGRLDEAVEQMRHAVNLDPDNPELNCMLAKTLQSNGMLDDASNICNDILIRNPGHTEAVIRQASILERQGKCDIAIEKIRPLINSGNYTPHVALIYSKLCGQTRNEEGGIAVLESALADSDLPKRTQYKLYKQLVKLYDKKSMFDKAFTANKLSYELKNEVFDIAHHKKFIEYIINAQTIDPVSYPTRIGSASDKPVFVVGMPRSGTTLVEQILATHSRVFGAGELPDIPEIAAAMANEFNDEMHYPYNQSLFNQLIIEKYTDRYLGKINELGSAALRVVDKLPHNYMYIGVIQLLFPNARVIHVKRHPVDTCLSCYFQDFSSAHSYVYDLEILGNYYSLYEEVMNHWKKVIKLPFLEVCYEDFVNDQERCTRRLIEFCGLEWEDGCMQFYKNERIVRTPSYDQVRQPMYDSSLNRWMHYKNHLAPLIDVLNEKITYDKFRTF